MANEDPKYTPEEFRKRQGNFHLFFILGHHLGHMRRATPLYQKCLELPGFSELADELGKLLDEGDGIYDSVCQERLYQAYEMMHPHAGSNYQLTN